MPITLAFAPPLPDGHMTGAAGDTTTTDSRSQRNRACRRGGQLLTRALGSSCASACPHFVLPVPLPMVAEVESRGGTLAPTHLLSIINPIERKRSSAALLNGA